MKFFLLVVFCAGVNSLPKLNRQLTVTLANASTPAVIDEKVTEVIKESSPPGPAAVVSGGNVEQLKPELVPTVIQPAIPVNTTAPQQQPPTKVDEDDESSEEEEDADADEEEGEEEKSDEEEEEDNGRRSLKESFIPGYITEQGELLVPIDTVQRNLQYTIIEDPNFKNYQQGQKVTYKKNDK